MGLVTLFLVRSHTMWSWILQITVLRAAKGTLIFTYTVVPSCTEVASRPPGFRMSLKWTTRTITKKIEIHNGLVHEKSRTFRRAMCFETKYHARDVRWSGMMIPHRGLAGLKVEVTYWSRMSSGLTRNGPRNARTPYMSGSRMEGVMISISCFPWWGLTRPFLTCLLQYYRHTYHSFTLPFEWPCAMVVAYTPYRLWHSTFLLHHPARVWGWRGKGCRGSKLAARCSYVSFSQYYASRHTVHFCKLDWERWFLLPRRPPSTLLFFARLIFLYFLFFSNKCLQFSAHRRSLLFYLVRIRFVRCIYLSDHWHPCACTRSWHFCNHISFFQAFSYNLIGTSSRLPLSFFFTHTYLDTTSSIARNIR